MRLHPQTKRRRPPIRTWRQLFIALVLSPFVWLAWAGRTFRKIIFALANGRIIGVRGPKQPIPRTLPPGIFGTISPYELYKDTRERLSAHAAHRSERQWTITTWVVGLLTAIIAGLMVMAMDGKELKPQLQYALSVWIVLMAVFALVRILHDQIIAMFHVRACQRMDKKFGLHFDDSKHKIDMQLHHFLMLLIFLLSAGALALVWKYDKIKSDPEKKTPCPCCCRTATGPETSPTTEGTPEPNKEPTHTTRPALCPTRQAGTADETPLLLPTTAPPASTSNPNQPIPVPNPSPGDETQPRREGGG
jgi:hypothetical protein